MLICYKPYDSDVNIYLLVPVDQHLKLPSPISVNSKKIYDLPDHEQRSDLNKGEKRN